MRVLHVHAGNLFGGVERILVSLVTHRGFTPEIEPVFALCFPGRLREELERAGAEVQGLCPVQLRRFWTIWKARKRLRALLRRTDCAVVVCHSCWSQAILGPVARVERRPLIFWQHTQAHGRHWTERWAKRVRPDLALCVSRTTAETLPRLYPRTPHEVVYSPLTVQERDFHGVDRSAVRQELATPTDAVVIIQVSRMEGWKGHRIHLEALGRLRRLPQWVCWIVGGPERPEELNYYAELQALAARWQIADRIRFLGRRTDVPRLLAAADLFCQPNLDVEGFSIAFMEAFYARLPIITSAIGGATEIVNETCGRLLSPGDAAALTAALGELVGAPALRRRLGEAGFERLLELCDPREQMRKLAQVFRRVAGRA